MNVPTYTILMVEDLAADRELYRRALSQDSSCVYELLEVESVAAGLAMCRTISIDAILLDYLLPDGNGLEFLAELSVQSNGMMPPAIMMTGQGNESTAVSAMKLGAEDYLVKRDLTPELLQLKVRRAIKNTRLLQQQQQQQQRFRASVENMLDCFGIYSAIRDRAGQIVDFRFDYLNAAAMQSNRMTEADMSRTLCEVFSAFRETGLFAEYCQVVETGIPLVKEDLVYTDVYGGERLTIAYNVQTAKLDDGFMSSWRDITAQKQSELSLQAANRQMTTIWEGMTDAYVSLDRDWRVIYTNPAATEVYRQLTNLTPAEYLGKTHWEVFPLMVNTIVDREYRRALAEGVAVHFELFYEQTETWFEIHAYPSDEGLGIYFRDVTERQQAAALLQTQQATIAAQLGEIESIYQMAPVGLCFVDTDFRYVRINEQLAQINGLSVAEHIGKTFQEALPELVKTIEPIYRQVMESGESIIDLEVTGTNRAQPGVERWWLASFYPQTDDRRRVIGVNNVVQEITDRKRLEAARLSAEQERDRFFAQSIDLLAIGNFEGYFERINPAFERLLGFSETEFVSRPFIDFVHPDDRESTLAKAQSLAQEEIVVDFENRCQCKDGSYVWVSWNATPYQQSNCWYGVGRDISLGKQMEAALRQRESQLRLFVQHAPAGVAMFDRDMRYVIASDVWIDCHDLRDREIVGRSHYDLYPDLPQRWKEVHQRCLAGAIESCEEDLFLRLDGSIDWVRWEIRPWYTNPDRVGGIIIFSEVITERKRQSAAILQSERKFSAIFNQTFQLMGLVSLDGVLLEINHAALNSVAASESEIVGKSFWDTPWWQTEQVQQQLKDAIATAASGQLVRYEVEFPNFSGGITITDFSLKPIFDEVGQVESIVAEGHDITDRKQAQADLEQRNQELDAFVYVVSHDLKAPLRAVANLSQWIEDDLKEQLTADTRFSKGDALRTQMNLLRSRVNRMAATIDGLLDYARVGRGEDAIEPVALARLLADVIDSVAPPPTFTIDLPTALPTLITKRLPLFQVFVNLIGNGIKHHHSEAGTIRIAIEERGDWYEVGVSDDGSGIAPEHHDRMFKIFQAVNPQKRSDSTGIGLAIVKKIVEAEGGTIRLESELGRGTTFYFTWPKRLV